MKNTKNLSVLAYSNGFTLWLYKTDLAADTLKAEISTHFDLAYYFLDKNDEIMVLTDDDQHLNYIVSDIDAISKSVTVVEKKSVV